MRQISSVLGVVLSVGFFVALFSPLFIARKEADKVPQRKVHLSEGQIAIAWICIFVLAGMFFLFFLFPLTPLDR